MSKSVYRWLLLLIVVLFVHADSLLNVTEPRAVPDTIGYTEFDFQYPELLLQQRTLGYPIYLQPHQQIAGSVAGLAGDT